MIDLLSLGRITSNFGPRKSPTAGASSNHQGVDIVLKSNNVPAVTSGTVIFNGIWGSGGNTLKIKDENGYIHHYLHLANKPNLSVGDKVTEGQTIGIQGKTGTATGVHLHYEVHNSNGSAINPVEFLKGAVGKISGTEDTTSGVMDSDSDSGLFGWKDTAKDIGKSIMVVIFIIVIIIIMFLTFTGAMGMELI